MFDMINGVSKLRFPVYKENVYFAFHFTGA